MTKRIFRSVCIAAIGIFLASTAVMMVVLYEYFSDMQMNRLRLQTELAAQGTANEGIDYFTDLDAGLYRITWVGPDGSVLYETGSDSTSMDSHLEREEIRQALEYGYGESIRYSDTLTKRLFYAAKKLPDGSVLRLADMQYTVWVLFWGIMDKILIVAAMAVGFSLALALRLSKSIVKPLNNLNLDEPAVNTVYPEIRPLLGRISSQQKQLQQQAGQLRQALELRREFTANVSHELKSPLHSISGYAELLKEGIVKQEDIPQFSERIYSEAQRMITLVEDIISLSHLDEGGEDFQRKTVDLYALTESVVQRLQPEARAAKINLSFKGCGTELYGVPQLLGGIIFNLCDNAIKYNHENGDVRVEITDDKNHILLTVTDTGIGIPEEYQERIFERFYRVDKSHSKEVGGTGLGLSIVKHAARFHNAGIELSSTPGIGTTVTVRFPKM